MNNIELANLLFPDIDKDINYYEEMYPPRELEESARVTRIAPSPTGFIHLGNLYGAIIDERLAHQSNGVFYLRIEDTDNKRKVDGAVDLIISTMKYFGIQFDEGAIESGDKGNYGPYRQRKRRDIYRAFAKYLVSKGHAYPCFCTVDDLATMRDEQKKLKKNFGYYGNWAVHRDLSYNEINKKLDKGLPYVIRFKSRGSLSNTVSVDDAIRGLLKIPENDQDIVLLKSDGIPTYHFAHVVDDHLMRTTHVVRGEEWLPTLAIHVQLFDAFGFKTPIYCHTAQLMKVDNGSKRKLSKRKDPELSLEYYRSKGYLSEAVWEYLLTILNSNYEEWRLANHDKDLHEFEFTTAKMSSSGSLFDLMKLNDISKEAISKMTSKKVYKLLVDWAKSYDTFFYNVITKEKDKTLDMLSIGRDEPNPRKDIFCWSQGKDFIKYIYDDYFTIEEDYPESVKQSHVVNILKAYLEIYSHDDSKEIWFSKVKLLTENLGYAVKKKDFKKNPDKYLGSIVDVTSTIRVALTGRKNSPNIWDIQQVLGEEALRNRITKAMNEIDDI